MRASETRQLVEQALEYPVTHEQLIEQLGRVELESPRGGGRTLAGVFESVEPTTYRSSDHVFETIMGNLDESFIGRKYYDDRGGVAGDPHPDADQVAY